MDFFVILVGTVVLLSEAIINLLPVVLNFLLASLRKVARGVLNRILSKNTFPGANGGIIPINAKVSFPNCIDDELYRNLKQYLFPNTEYVYAPQGKQSTDHKFRCAPLTLAALVYDLAYWSRHFTKTKIDEIAAQIAKLGTNAANATCTFESCIITLANGIKIDIEILVLETDCFVCVAFAGTEPFEATDWISNGCLTLSSYAKETRHLHDGKIIDANATVHTGFVGSLFGIDHNGKVSAYASIIIPKLLEIFRRDTHGEKQLYLTGHSLGGSLALLAAYDIAIRERQLLDALRRGGVVTMGAAKVGDHAFQQEYPDSLKAVTHNYVHGDEFAPLLPPGQEYVHLPGNCYDVTRVAGGVFPEDIENHASHAKPPWVLWAVSLLCLTPFKVPRLFRRIIRPIPTGCTHDVFVELRFHLETVFPTFVWHHFPFYILNKLRHLQDHAD